MLLAIWLRAGNLQVACIWESCVLLASWLRAGNLQVVCVWETRESCELAACGKVAVQVPVDCVRRVSEFCAGYHNLCRDNQH